MIKILHTADWHLGQLFFGYERVEEHRHFLDWLAGELHRQAADVLLIAGDVFDVPNPSAVSQKMFYHFVKKVTSENPHLQLVVIAGNHDSAARLEAPLPLLEEMNTWVKGIVRKTKEGIDYDDLLVELRNKAGDVEVVCMAVPFLRQGDYPAVDTDGNPYAEGVKAFYTTLYKKAEKRRQSGQAILAMGHLQATGSEIAETDHSERTIIGGLECVSPEAFEGGIAYTALGHIHKAQRVSGRENIRYAGTPLSMSFAEKNYHHGVEEILIDQGELVSIRKLDYTPLVRLISVPAVPKAPELVLAELAELPDLDTVDDSPFPFLEVKVLLSGPEPALRYEIENVLSGKRVRLARIVSRYLEKDSAASATEEVLKGLDEMSPLQLVETVFYQKYQVDMPADMKEIFMEVYLEVNQNKDDKV